MVFTNGLARALGWHVVPKGDRKALIRVHLGVFRNHDARHSGISATSIPATIIMGGEHTDSASISDGLDGAVISDETKLDFPEHDAGHGIDEGKDRYSAHAVVHSWHAWELQKDQQHNIAEQGDTGRI